MHLSALAVAFVALVCAQEDYFAAAVAAMVTVATAAIILGQLGCFDQAPLDPLAEPRASKGGGGMRRGNGHAPAGGRLDRGARLADPSA